MSPRRDARGVLALLGTHWHAGPPPYGHAGGTGAQHSPTAAPAAPSAPSYSFTSTSARAGFCQRLATGRQKAPAERRGGGRQLAQHPSFPAQTEVGWGQRQEGQPSPQGWGTQGTRGAAVGSANGTQRTRDTHASSSASGSSSVGESSPTPAGTRGRDGSGEWEVCAQPCPAPRTRC